jgi:hypothetical protein
MKISRFEIAELDVEKSPVDPGVNTFLFADVGIETNGMMLSVLSTFSRQGIDPWEEAATLSRLPSKAARDRLARLIAEMPESLWPMPVAASIAGRLISLLPAHAAAATKPASVLSRKRTGHLYRAITLVGAALVGLTLNVMSHHAPAPPHGAGPVASLSAPASPARFR